MSFFINKTGQTMNASTVDTSNLTNSSDNHITVDKNIHLKDNYLVFDDIGKKSGGRIVMPSGQYSYALFDVPDTSDGTPLIFIQCDKDSRTVLGDIDYEYSTATKSMVLYSTNVGDGVAFIDYLIVLSKPFS